MSRALAMTNRDKAHSLKSLHRLPNCWTTYVIPLHEFTLRRKNVTRRKVSSLDLNKQAFFHKVR